MTTESEHLIGDDFVDIAANRALAALKKTDFSACPVPDAVDIHTFPVIYLVAEWQRQKLKRKDQAESAPQQEDKGNWLEITKSGIRAHGIMSLVVLLLLWLAYAQYKNNSQAHSDRDSNAQVVRHANRLATERGTDIKKSVDTLIQDGK